MEVVTHHVRTIIASLRYAHSCLATYIANRAETKELCVLTSASAARKGSASGRLVAPRAMALLLSASACGMAARPGRVSFLIGPLMRFMQVDSPSRRELCAEAGLQPIHWPRILLRRARGA